MTSHATIEDHDNRNPWDQGDIDLLRELGPNPDISWDEVGKQLGRTAGACRSKWYRLR